MLRKFIAFLGLRRSGEWSPHYARRPQRLVTGETQTGLLMRRYDGGWQYRRPTFEEEYAYADDRAW
jgi:hypothetical protein